MDGNGERIVHTFSEALRKAFNDLSCDDHQIEKIVLLSQLRGKHMTVLSNTLDRLKKAEKHLLLPFLIAVDAILQSNRECVALFEKSVTNVFPAVYRRIPKKVDVNKTAPFFTLSILVSNEGP